MSVMPEVDIWIECDECNTAWALRRNLLDGKWLWTRDCKHKKAGYTARDEKGPLPKESDVSQPVVTEGHQIRGGDTT